MKTKQGISLIVLVIAIIIMLILAGAVILTLSDTNIIDRASSAVSKVNLSQIQEMASVAWTEAYVDGKKAGKVLNATELETAVINSLKANGIKENELNNYTITVTTEGVTVEIAGPTLTVDQTLGNSAVGATSLNSRSFMLSGTVIDKTGISSLKVNGVEVEVDNDGKWSTNFTLAKNETLEITVVATNNINNSTTIKGYVAYIEYVDIAVTQSNLSTLNCAIDANGVLNIPATYYNEDEDVCYRATSIGYNAFNGCTSLTSVTIPDSVTSIGPSAFINNTSLTSVTIPDSVTSIGKSGFNGCTSLTNVTLSANLISIGDYGFNDCKSIESIVIPEGVTSIGMRAFANCTNLVTLTLPSSLTSIGGSAFTECRKIKTVNYNGTLEQWLGINFMATYATPCWYAAPLYINGAMPTDIVIPESITSIGQYAFCGVKSLTSVTMHENVTSIATYAFYGCNKLTNASIPTNVNAIGTYAFGGTSITSAIIPEGVTTISANAFKGCKSLTSVTITEGVTSIGSYAFDGCEKLESIVIPDTVTSIAQYSFKGCANLTSATISNNMTSIAPYAFSACGLTDVKMGNSITKIDNSAFEGCSKLTNITLPATVKSIGTKAFYKCTGLTSVTFGNTEGWYVTTTANETSGTDVSVTDTTTNATNLKTTYYSYYWYCK